MAAVDAEPAPPSPQPPLEDVPTEGERTAPDSEPTEDGKTLPDDEPTPMAEDERSEPIEGAHAVEKNGNKKDEGVEMTPVPRKRGRGRRMSAGEAEKEERVERPSRERKKVERYAALTPRSSATKKTVSIVQGSGMKLKDIPNVAFKLSKRRVDENLQNLHSILFGRKSNAHFVKRNLSQFSGFVWTGNKDKHRARVRDKLEKSYKEKLLDICEILDIHDLKLTSRKEEIIDKLLEFLESPHTTRNTVLTDQEKSKKRIRSTKANTQATAEDVSSYQNSKKQRKIAKRGEVEKSEDDQENEGDQDDGEDHEDGEEDQDVVGTSEEDASDIKDEGGLNRKAEQGVSDQDEDEEDELEEPHAKKFAAAKQSAGKSGGKKLSSSTKKAAENEPQSEDSKGAKGMKKSSGAPSKTSESPSEDSNRGSKSKKPLENKTTKGSSKSQEKDSTKTVKRRTSGAPPVKAPSGEEIRQVLTVILKEVDFNTATLSDIIRQLGSHFKVDLMSRKVEIKGLIEEAINSMSDFEEDEDDAEENENGKQDTDEKGDAGDKPGDDAADGADS